MERYFFDVVDGADHKDEIGSEWPDLAAARVEAIRLSGEILKEMPERYWHAELWTMTVSNRLGPLFTLKFVADDADPVPGHTRI